MGPLRAGGYNEVGGATIGVGVHVRAVVALPAGRLGCGENAEMVVARLRPEVESSLAGVDIVVDLLGNHRHVGRFVELVAAAAILVGVVIFDCEFGLVGSADVGTGAEGLRLEGGYLGEAVIVVVVAVAVAALAEEEHAGALVSGDYGCVERGVIVECSGDAYGSERVGHFG